MYFLSAFMTMLSLVSFATCNLLVERRIFSDDVVDLKWASLVTACLLVFSVQVPISFTLYARNLQVTVVGKYVGTF